MVRPCIKMTSLFYSCHSKPIWPFFCRNKKRCLAERQKVTNHSPWIFFHTGNDSASSLPLCTTEERKSGVWSNMRVSHWWENFQFKHNSDFNHLNATTKLSQYRLYAVHFGDSMKISAENNARSINTYDVWRQNPSKDDIKTLKWHSKPKNITSASLERKQLS